MTILTVDEAVIAALKPASGPTELRDGKGNLIGVFSPMTELRDGVGNLLGVFSPKDGYRGYRTTPFTEADIPEIERRMASSGPGRTTRQVFERLLTLTSDPGEQAHLQKLIDRLGETD